MRGPFSITGGAGFIGCNLAHRLLSTGSSVILLDNLSRTGVEKNLRWLRKTHGEHVQAEIADVLDAKAVLDAVSKARQVFHFAAQVAVTTSLDDPRHDFAVNAGGTLNVLEAIRAQADPPPLVFTSTNKVYGGLVDIALEQREGRYEPRDPAIRTHGMSEDRPLDFHSPYGCSKGTADQYVLDYARSYGLEAIVFRMSCIYGPHQFGTEDQGWVAHFLIRAMRGKPDHALWRRHAGARHPFRRRPRRRLLAGPAQHGSPFRHAPSTSAAARRTRSSLLELLDLIEKFHGDAPDVAMQEWRTGDQRYYVSDTRRFQQATGWQPKIGWRRECGGCTTGCSMCRVSLRCEPKPIPRGASRPRAYTLQRRRPGRREAHERVRRGSLTRSCCSSPTLACSGNRRARFCACHPRVTSRARCNAVAHSARRVVASALPICPVWEGREWFTLSAGARRPGARGLGYRRRRGRRCARLLGLAIASRRSRTTHTPSTTWPSTMPWCPCRRSSEHVELPGEPLGCAMNIFARSDIHAGQTVAIVGIGFLGALLTQLASAAGARVIAISRRPFALEVARRLRRRARRSRWMIMRASSSASCRSRAERVASA